MALSRWSTLRRLTSTVNKLHNVCSVQCSSRVFLTQSTPVFPQIRCSSTMRPREERDADATELRQECEIVENEKIFDRDFEELTVDKYESLIKDDEDRRYIQKVLEDYEYVKYCTSRVPSTITVGDMKRLIESCRGGSDQSLANFFNYLFKKQMMKLAAKRVRHRKAEKHHEKIATMKEYEIGTLFDPSTDEPIYRKWHNSILMRLKESTMAEPKYWKVFTSTKFGPKVVVDNSFTNYMDSREISLTATQLCYIYGANGGLDEPFDLWFCNYQPESALAKKLEIALPNISTSALISLETRSYLDIFPKERLLYLTPDAPRPLMELSDDDIPIIGALVDKTIIKPLTMAKARTEGIRMARLPIDEFVVWGKSTKSLTLNQVIEILGVYRQTRDWRQALITGVPSRKLKSKEQIEQENELRKKKLMKRNRIFKQIPNFQAKPYRKY